MAGRILTALLIALGVASTCAASVALVRDPAIASAQTPHGPVAVTLQPVNPNPVVTLIVLSETLTSDDLVRIRRAVIKIPPSQIFDLSGGSLHPWKATLPISHSPLSLTDLLTELAASSTYLPGNWSTLLIVGRVPSESAAEQQSQAWYSAWITDLLRNHHLRVSFWSLDATTPAWAQDLAQSTLGSVSSSFPVLTDPQAAYEAAWSCPLKAGSWPAIVTLTNKDGGRLASLNTLCGADGFAPPLATYLVARAHNLDDETAARTVLSFNPADADALSALGKLYQRQKKPKEAAAMWRQLTEVTPLDGKLWAELGTVSYDSDSFDEAEHALAKASELGVTNKSTLQMQALLHFRRNDFAAATQLADQALALDAKDQSLFLLKADCAHGLKRSTAEAEATERAIQLGPVPIERTTALIELYLTAGQTDRASIHLRTVTNALPRDAATQCRYAKFWEQAQDDAAAHQLWQNALSADSKFEMAYIGLAANELRTSHKTEALRVASEGLNMFPQSEPLVLLKVQVLEMSGDLYGARRLLTQCAPGTHQRELLESRARLEDLYGAGGAEAYTALLKTLTAETGSPDAGSAARISEICRRGLSVSIRDQRLEQAQAFAARLASLGDPGGTALLKNSAARVTSKVSLPGGADAFYFLLFGNSHAKPDHILTDASRYLANEAEIVNPAGKSDWQLVGRRIHEYFQEIAALSALGENKGGVVKVELTLATKPGKQRTQKVFDILGLKMKRAKDNVTVQSAVGKEEAKKQDTLAALAIDDQAIQEALAAGKTYILELPVDSVPVYPAEALWQQAFYSHGQFPGGLAEALATDIRLPRLYLALNSMDRAAAESLLKAMSLRALAEQYSLPLADFSSALAIRAGRAEVPGGRRAEAIWMNLAGETPANPASFFQHLLSKDDGRLMAFFYTLSELDSLHQSFFTRSSDRTRRFYELFKDSAEMRRGGLTRLGNSSFTDFLRDVPLSDDGSVDFPGSPQVWMVAKGHNTSSVGKMTRKMKKSATPDDEDEILIRLAKTGYKVSTGQLSELANFIAVTRIDEQRDNPLDEEAALLLAQGYAEYHGLFPYFTALGDLTAADYQSVFAFQAKLKAVDAATGNLRAGEFHSLLAMLALLRESGMVAPEKVTLAYRACIQRYLQANDAGAWTSASLSAIDDLSQLVADGTPSRDQAIRRLLIGPYRQKSYDQVLALQKVPSLDSLCTIRTALKQIANNPRALDEIDRQLLALVVMPVPKEWKASGEGKKYLDFFETASARNTVAKLRERLAKKKRNQADIDTLSAQLLGQIEPWVQIAMTGRIYARFLEPTDLLVSEDPMLLRKHEFVNLGAKIGNVEYFPSSMLELSGEKSGSRFEGGLAEFSLAAGAARAAGNHLSAAADPAFAKALLGSVRATDWRAISPAGLMSFSEPIRLAREWIVGAGSSPAMLLVLETESRGILSINRRNALLDALERHDWPLVWQSVTVSDLHFLGDALLTNAPPALWNTAALKAMRAAAAHSHELDLLGAVAPDLNGCGQPRLRRYEPYEEYQRHVMPGRLAQRCAELKLYLAWMADGMAWPPEALEDVAPAAADYLLQKVQMHDRFDWQPALDAMGALQVTQVESFRHAQ